MSCSSPFIIFRDSFTGIDLKIPQKKYYRTGLKFRMSMTTWRKSLMKKWWEINKDKVIHKEYLTEQIQARRRPERERFCKKLWHILNQKHNPSQQHQTLQMRQIWNTGFDLPALFSCYTAWAGAVEKLLCRECWARTCTEVTQGKWLEAVRLVGLQKSKLEVFETLLWKRKGMIYSVLWKG